MFDMSYIKFNQVFHSYRVRKQQADEGNDLKPAVQYALKNVNLTIKKGEFVAILGHNGSGKSTLARHLNALLKPAQGTVWVQDYSTADSDSTLKIRQNVGMVFQNPDNQIIANVVEEDVGFGPENLGVETKAIWERVAESLKIVDMEKYRNHSPNHLSGGQKQRIAIAGVLAMHPDCIVLDEATAMLDPEGRREVMATVERLNREEHMTVILITHYMEEAVHADTVYVMCQGKVRMQGRPSEIFSREVELRDCGLRPPQVAQLAEELRRAGIPMPEAILTEEELVEALCQLK